MGVLIWVWFWVVRFGFSDWFWICLVSFVVGMAGVDFCGLRVCLLGLRVLCFDVVLGFREIVGFLCGLARFGLVVLGLWYLGGSVIWFVAFGG